MIQFALIYIYYYGIKAFKHLCVCSILFIFIAGWCIRGRDIIKVKRRKLAREQVFDGVINVIV